MIYTIDLTGVSNKEELHDALQETLPLLHVASADVRGEVQPFDDEFRDALLLQDHRHLVDRTGVRRGYDRILGDTAEHGDLLPDAAR